MSRISVLWRPLGPSFPASGLLHGPFPRPTVLAALAGDESARNSRSLRTAARGVRAREAQLVKAVFEKNLQILRIEHPLQFAWLGVSIRSLAGRRAGVGKSSKGTFPQAAMPQNSFDHVLLTPLNEADDLHPRTTFRTLQGVHLEHPL